MRADNGVKHGRLLLVEDDAEMRSVVAEAATRAGFDVAVPDGRTNAVAEVLARPPDVVVLGDSDGGRTLSRIRDVSGVPIVVLTARATEIEKVRALRAGADDYVTGATGRREFVARIEAVARRGRQVRPEAATFVDDGLVVDRASPDVRAAGRNVRLTPLEYRLLSALVSSPGELLSHARLAELVWGTRTAVDADAVRLYVSYLRRKLGPGVRDRIETVRGFGYRYGGSRRLDRT